MFVLERSQEDDDCHRAVISWYSRPEELPLKHIRQFKRYPRVKSPKELFQNVQPFDKDIDAETIFGKCKVSCLLQPGIAAKKIYMEVILRLWF